LPTNWTSNKIDKLRGKVLLIEGGLFYDNLHFANGDASNPIERQPKRFSLWEIHPVTSVKVCKKIKVSQCNPDHASDWSFLALTNDVLNQPPPLDIGFARAACRTIGEGVICPTGCQAIWVSSPFCKNIFVFGEPKSNLQLHHPVPQEGRFAIVTNVGCGMQWTRQHQARECVLDEGR